MMHEWTEGERIGGRYQVERRIGKGGRSNVYVVLDKCIEKEWVVKQLIDTKEAWQEIDILKRLFHPQIPRIVDVIPWKGQIGIVMDYMKGRNLGEWVRSNGYISEREVMRIGIQLCEILQYLHGLPTPILYHDMKPDNIIMSDNKTVYLVDFGAARQCGVSVSQATWQYAAPEQYQEGGVCDERTDVYTLGATLHRLMGVDENVTAKSDGLSRIIRCACRKEKKARYQTIDHMKDELEVCITGETRNRYDTYHSARQLVYRLWEAYRGRKSVTIRTKIVFMDNHIKKL